MSTVQNNPAVRAYYQSLIKKKEGNEESTLSSSTLQNNAPPEVTDTYSFNGEDLISDYNKVLLGLTVPGVPTSQGTTITEDNIIAGILTAYPELQEALDDATLNTIATATIAYAQAKGLDKLEDLTDFVTLGVELAQMAESKGVDKTDYITARIIEFAAMQEVNPNMTLEEMNETLAFNKTSELLLNSMVPQLSELFGTEIVSFEQLLELQNYELLLADEYPIAKEGYIQTSRMTYLTLASDGELTNQDYYDLIKLDLRNIFPNFDEMDEAAINELMSKIDCLTSEEVEIFINKSLALPGCYENGYSTALEIFLKDFESATSGKATYNIENPNEKIDFNQVYKSCTGVEFNPDAIIETNTTIKNLETLMSETANYQVVENILTAVSNGEMDVESALWQIAYLQTGSTDEQAILAFLKDVTGKENIIIENNRVIINSEAPASRGVSAPDSDNEKEGLLNTVTDWCKSAYQKVVNFCVSESVRANDANADWNSISGVCDYIAGAISNPDLYNDFGNMCLGASGVVALGSAAGVTAPITLSGAGLLAMIGGASKAIGATIDFLQGGEYNSATIVNYAGELAEAGVDFVGGKYINAALELPSAIKGVLNKVTSGLSNLIGKAKSWVNANSTNVAFSAEDLASIENLKTLLNDDDVPQSVKTVIQDAINSSKKMDKDVVEGIRLRKEGAAYYRAYAENKEALMKKLYEDYAYCSDNRLRGILKSKGVDATNLTREQMIEMLVQEDYKNLEPVFKQVQALKQYASTNTNSVPLTVTRSEYDKIASQIQVNGKSLMDYLREGDYETLLRELNKGNTSFTFNKMTGTSMMEGWPTTDVNWIINAPAGSKGVFADLVGGYDKEWEWLMAEGTKVNIDSAFFNEYGELFLNATVEVTTSNGKKITKQVAITAGVIAGGSTAANAQGTPSGGQSSGGGGVEPPTPSGYNPPNPPITPPSDGGDDGGNGNNTGSGGNTGSAGDTPTSNPPAPGLDIPTPPGETPDIGKNKNLNPIFHDSITIDGGNINSLPQEGNSPFISPDEIINNTTNDIINNLEEALRKKFGEGADISIKVTHSIDANGNVTYQVSYFVRSAVDGDGAGSGTGSGSGSGSGSGGGVGDGDGSGNGNGAGAGTLPENTGWQGAMGQYILNHYMKPDGTLDTEAMIDDWLNNGGEVVSFTQNEDGTWSAGGYNRNSGGSGGYGSGGYGTGSGGENHYHTGGFDVFATGGGGSSGSSSFDAFCEAMLNGWRQAFGDGGQRGDAKETKPKADKFKAAGAR